MKSRSGKQAKGEVRATASHGPLKIWGRIREGEVPSELLLGAGSDGASPSRTIVASLHANREPIHPGSARTRRPAGVLKCQVMSVANIIDVKFADSDQLIRGFGDNHHQLA